ncbi:MAG: hypothetical protein LAO51_00905 [Acidobacteriia bacterium]|nr:hypothetical protein [Terriglobia bacterium]
MGFIKALSIVVVLAGAVGAAASAAGSAPAQGRAGDLAFALDEYSVAAGRGPDTWQTAAGLTFGDAFRQRYHLFGGGRLSWVKASRAGSSSNGWGLGAIGGIGYRPTRRCSPLATLAVDKLFGLGGDYRFELTGSAGVRIRTVARLDPEYAISFLLFRSTLYGSSGVENQSAFGVAAAFSLAFLHRS